MTDQADQTLTIREIVCLEDKIKAVKLVEQLIAEAHKGYSPNKAEELDDIIAAICADHDGKELCEFCVVDKEKLLAWHQAEVDRAVAAQEYKTIIALVGDIAASGTEAAVERAKNRASELSSVHSPHNPTQPDWREQQNVYRNDKGELRCSTCGGEVFGGICDCMPDESVQPQAGRNVSS